jgi:molecular chaperone DnaK
MLRVAVDFGTSSTCTAVSIDGRQPQVVVVDGVPLVPSSVYAPRNGTLFVGHEADRQAAMDPSRYEPHPKRRIDEGELLLGDTVLPVLGVVRAVLSRAVREARRLAADAAADQLVLTHPADWGAPRTGKLRNAASGLAGELILVPEPVAAAVFYSVGNTVPVGAALAVLDMGGGTVDASVVRREPGGGFRVLATGGDPTFGGADIDQAVLEHVGAQVSGTDPDAWWRLVAGRELADRRRRRVLGQDVRGAKETLSRHSYTDVPMPVPFPDAHVTRESLEKIIEEPMGRTVRLLTNAIAHAGLRPDQLAGVFLVGGSSRIPMVSRLVHERLGVMPVTLDQPETVVARGALLAVMANPGGARLAQPHRVPPPALAPVPAPRLPRPSPPPMPPAALVKPTPPGFPPPAQPPPARARRRPVPWPWMVVAGITLLAVVGTVLAVSLPSSPNRIAQFHYEFIVPDGWEQIGSNAQFREADLRPTGGEAGIVAKIIVQERELNYNATDERERAVSQLRADYDEKRSQRHPPAFDEFDENFTFAGRDVIYYSERDADEPVDWYVDWYVVFQGRYEVSVGCQRGGDSEADRVKAACDRVVRSLTING